MKIAISSKGNSLESKFDEHFGRAPWFCVVDKTTQNYHFIENKNANGMGGAGTKTAELMAQLNIEQVISGDFGPKAKNLLERLNIQMIILEESDILLQQVFSKMNINL